MPVNRPLALLVGVAAMGAGAMWNCGVTVTVDPEMETEGATRKSMISEVAVLFTTSGVGNVNTCEVLASVAVASTNCLVVGSI